jgi:uncharacterized protein YuzE
MVRFRYDAEVDALYLELREGPAAESIEITDAIYVDVDATGQPIGVEWLDPSGFLAFLRERGGDFELPERVVSPAVSAP